MATKQPLRQSLRHAFMKTSFSEMSTVREPLPHPLRQGQVFEQSLVPKRRGLSRLSLTFSAPKKITAGSKVLIRLELLPAEGKDPLFSQTLSQGELNVFTRTFISLPRSLLRPGQSYRLRLSVMDLDPGLKLKLHLMPPQNGEVSIDGRPTAMGIACGFVYSRIDKMAVALSLLLLALAAFFFIESPPLLPQLIRQSLLLSMLLAGLANLFLVEALNELNARFWLRPSILLLSLLIILWIQALLLGLTGSPRAAVFLTLSLFAILALANHFKQFFRGDPLFAADIPSLGMAMKTGDQLVYTLQTRFVLAFCGMLTFASLFIHLQASFSDPVRRAALVAACLLAGPLLIGGAILRDKTAAKLGLGQKTWNPMADYRHSGFIIPFIRSIRELFIASPQKQGKVPPSLHEVKEPVARHRLQPNILVVMSESFCDFRNIADFRTSEPVMPFFDSLKAQPDTRSGYLRVPIFGGGTSNTEFEYLTGSSMHFFSDASVPFLSFVKKPMHGLPDVLNQQGYQSLALHPYDPTFYRRHLVYPLLGFDAFISEDDFKSPQRINRFISDRCHFENMLRLLQDKKAGKRQMIFSVTMQNHFPYHGTEENFARLPYRIHLPDHAQSQDVELYLSQLRASDDALRFFIEKLKQYPEPTLLLFFGDHLPGNSRGFTRFYHDLFGQPLGELDFAQSQKLYETPYLFWANYPLPKNSEPLVSANFLGGMTLDFAGAIRSPYYDFLSELHQDILVFGSHYLQTPNSVLTDSPFAGPLADKVRRYWSYQRDNLS